MLLQQSKRSLLLLDTAAFARVAERLFSEVASPMPRRGVPDVVRQASALRIQHGMLLQPRKRSLLLDTAATARVSDRPDSEYVSPTSAVGMGGVLRGGGEGQ